MKQQKKKKDRQKNLQPPNSYITNLLFGETQPLKKTHTFHYLAQMKNGTWQC